MLLLLFCIKIEDEKRCHKVFSGVARKALDKFKRVAIRASFDSCGTDKDEAMIDEWYWFFVTKIDISKKKIHQRKQITRLKIQIIFVEFMWHPAVIEELVNLESMGCSIHCVVSY